MTAAKATPAHTPGPWHISQYGQVCAPGSDEAIRVWGGVSVPSGSHPAVDESKANAARIVACVNACEGMLPEVLDEYANEGGMFLVFGRHMAKRDEEIFALRAEVERVKGLLRFMVDAAYTEPGMQIYKAHIEEARKELSNN